MARGKINVYLDTNLIDTLQKTDRKIHIMYGHPVCTISSIFNSIISFISAKQHKTDTRIMGDKMRKSKNHFPNNYKSCAILETALVGVLVPSDPFCYSIIPYCCVLKPTPPAGALMEILLHAKNQIRSHFTT